MTKAKVKTNWKQPHKVVLHPNRWLIWSLAVSILVCSALIAHIQISEIYFQTQMNQMEKINSTWTVFKHKTAGYSVMYPRAWGLEADGESNITFINLKNIDEYFAVTVYPADQEDEVRRSLFTTKESSTKISGHAAIKISQSPSQPENVIMVRDAGNLFVLRGTGGNFNRIADSFIFTQKLERI